jgi:hypothetical protein
VTDLALTLASSLPLCVGDSLIGVLAMYGRPEQEITVGQRRALESLLPTISSSVGAALHRPGAAIDCEEPHIRAAVMAALDGMLSHDRHLGPDNSGSVVAISLARPTADTARSSRLELAAQDLAATLSPNDSDSRYILRISDEQFLLCGTNGATYEQLTSEIVTASSSRALSAFSVTTSPVRTPLELQLRVRHAVDVLNRTTQRRTTDSVH